MHLLCGCDALQPSMQYVPLQYKRCDLQDLFRGLHTNEQYIGLVDVLHSTSAMQYVALQ